MRMSQLVNLLLLLVMGNLLLVGVLRRQMLTWPPSQSIADSGTTPAVSIPDMGPCGGLFGVWTGRGDKLPLVYELAIKSMIKVDPRFKIHSVEPIQRKDWYPEVVVTSEDRIIKDLADIHPEEIWRKLFRKLDKSPANKSDLLRIWRLYTEGGFYTDLDIIWLHQIPYDVSKALVVSHDGDGGVLSAAIGGPKHDPLWRTFLEQMPDLYDSNLWESIGGPRLGRVLNSELAVDKDTWQHHIMKGGFLNSPNVFDPLKFSLPNGRELISISDIQMYGLRYTEAPTRFDRPMTPDDVDIYAILSKKSFTQHVFGNRHRRNMNRWPSKGSYFDTLFNDIGLDSK